MHLRSYSTGYVVFGEYSIIIIVIVIVMLQIEYSFANSHQSLSASNFIMLCNVSVSRDLLRAIILFWNTQCIIARRRSLETETLQAYEV